MTQDLKGQCFMPKNAAQSTLALLNWLASLESFKRTPLRVDIRQELEKALAQDLSGMRLAPLVATNKMRHIGDAQLPEDLRDDGYSEAIWDVMLKVSPDPLDAAAPKPEEK